MTPTNASPTSPATLVVIVPITFEIHFIDWTR